MQKTRIAFHTLGCKLNFSETSTITRQFGLQDFEIVDFGQEADVYVVHTCSVTATAEQKCKASIRQAHRRNPAARVAVMGCAAQSNPEMFLKMEGVSWVLGNEDKFRLEEYVRNGIQATENEDYHHIARQETGDISKTKTFIPSYSMNDRTRSFFKVQDGCDYFCTYCSIPFMRGRSRSESVGNTMKVAREIASSSVQEIILTGVNIGDFGRQNGERFIDLLMQLDHLKGIERIRISSIEPELLNDEIIHLVKNSTKLLPHFHIPLQSGNDRILDLMKRKYKREVFSNRVNTIKLLMPDACIAADVIVGFPGETEAEFMDAYRFIESLDITYMHLFTYSERPGTKALQMEGKVSEQEKRRRSKIMHELSEKKKLDFYKRQIGKVYNILWESDRSGEYMLGWTENYVHCRTKYNQDLVNTIVASRLVSINLDKDAIFDVETV